VLSPSLIRSWPGDKFKYYRKFDLGIGAEWMGTTDYTDVGVDDMTSLLDYGFKVDFLKSMDMSVFDSCLGNEEGTVDGFNITEADSAGLQTAQSKKDLSLTLQRKPLSTLDNHSQYALSYSKEEMVRAARGVVPVNTKIGTKWAVKNFTE